MKEQNYFRPHSIKNSKVSSKQGKCDKQKKKSRGIGIQLSDEFLFNCIKTLSTDPDGRVNHGPVSTLALCKMPLIVILRILVN